MWRIRPAGACAAEPVPSRAEGTGFFMPLRLLLLALAACCAAPLAAQSAPDSLADTLADRVLPGVTVSAARTPVPTAEAAARVSVYGRADAEAAGASSVADLLERRSPVFLKRYGPSGLASLSLRGTSASQTAVLLDGHRFADPQLGQLDVALLPSILFERVEVASGPASALYGTDAVGGVVNLRTQAGGRRFQLRTEAGAFGERSVAVLAQDEITTAAGTRVGALAAVEQAQDQGDYRYYDPTTPNFEAGTPGTWKRRIDADQERTSLLARLRAERGGASGSVGVWAGRAERGLVGLSAQPARQWDRHLRLWADASAPLGRARLTLQGFHQRGGLRYESRAVTSDGTTRTWSGEARAALPLPTAFPARGVWRLTTGAQLTHASADHAAFPDSIDARTPGAALFASADADYGRVRLFPALRLDRTSGGDALSPSLGLNVQPLAWNGFHLKARAARAFRAPTLNERFWPQGGDPELRPERGWTAEAGAALRIGPETARLDVEATVFQSALRDQIVWLQPLQAVNIGRVESMGYELSADATLGRPGRLRAELGGLVTVQRARDRSNPDASSYGQPLLYVPDLQAKAYAALGIGPLRLDAGIQHAGRRTIAADGTRSLPPYAVLGAGARLRLPLPRGAGLTLGARLENLTDRAYQVVTNYPMPPRHLRFSLTLNPF